MQGNVREAVPRRALSNPVVCPRDLTRRFLIQTDKVVYSHDFMLSSNFRRELLDWMLRLWEKGTLCIQIKWRRKIPPPHLWEEISETAEFQSSRLQHRAIRRIRRIRRINSPSLPRNSRLSLPIRNKPSINQLPQRIPHPILTIPLPTNNDLHLFRHQRPHLPHPASGHPRHEIHAQKACGVVSGVAQIFLEFVGHAHSRGADDVVDGEVVEGRVGLDHEAAVTHELAGEGGPDGVFVFVDGYVYGCMVAWWRGWCSLLGWRELAGRCVIHGAGYVSLCACFLVSYVFWFEGVFCLGGVPEVQL
jgi:hypothetical protein